MKKVQAMLGTLIFLGALAALPVSAVFAEEGAMEPAAEPTMEQPAEPAMEPAAEPAMEEAAEPAMEPALTIERLMISEDVVDHEPVGASDVFAAGMEKVYCFVEAKDIKEDTTVDVVWYHDGNEMARVPLMLRQGERWRTYSSKKLGGNTGNWKVELQDANGAILKAVQFTVQ